MHKGEGTWDFETFLRDLHVYVFTPQVKRRCQQGDSGYYCLLQSQSQACGVQRRVSTSLCFFELFVGVLCCCFFFLTLSSSHLLRNCQCLLLWCYEN